MKKYLLIGLIVLLTGCATGSGIREKLTGEQFDEPKVEQQTYLKQKYTNSLFYLLP